MEFGRELIENENKLKALLSKLNDIPGIVFAVIIRKDGVLPAITPFNLGEDFLANFSSACAGIFGAHIAQHEIMNEPDPEQILAETETSKIFIYDVEENSLLVIKTLPKVNLGLLRLTVKNSLPQIRKLLIERREKIEETEMLLKEKFGIGKDLQSALKHLGGTLGSNRRKEA